MFNALVDRCVRVIRTKGFVTNSFDDDASEEEENVCGEN